MDAQRADTEVRAPAALLLGPCERLSWDGRPAERTRRSAPPPSCLWAQADGLLGWMSSGTEGRVDPGLFSAHWDGGFSTNAQRADTEVRAPAMLLLGPFERLSLDGYPAERTQRSALPRCWIWLA